MTCLALVLCELLQPVAVYYRPLRNLTTIKQVFLLSLWNSWRPLARLLPDPSRMLKTIMVAQRIIMGKPGYLVCHPLKP